MDMMDKLDMLDRLSWIGTTSQQCLLKVTLRFFKVYGLKRFAACLPVGRV